MKQNLDVRNTFTILDGEKAVATAHNGVVWPMAALCENNAFATYMAVGNAVSDGAFMNEPICIKKTELTNYNFDPQNGRLFATYEIVLDENDVENGTKISEACLTGFSDASIMSNYCSFSPVVKGADDLTVRATVYMDAEGDNYCLVGGDNVIARILLGAADLSCAELSLVTSDNRHPLVSAPREHINVEYTNSAWMSANEDSFYVCGGISEPTAEVIIITSDGRALLRSFFYREVYASGGTAKLKKGGSAVIGSYEDTDILSVTDSSGNEIYPKRILRASNYLTTDCVQLTDIKGEAGSTLLGDGAGVYVAIVNSGDVVLLRTDGLELKRVCSLKRVGAVAITSDGAVLQAKNGSIDGSVPSLGGERNVFSVEMGEGEVKGFDAICYGGKYKAVVRFSDRVEILTFSSEGEIEASSVMPATDAFSFKMDENYLCYGSAANTEYHCEGIGYENSLVVTNLTSLSKFANIKHGGGRVVYAQSLNGIMLMDIVDGNSVSLSTAEKAVLCSDYAVISSGGTVTSALTMFSGETGIRKVPVYGSISAPTSIVRAGRYILLCGADGMLTTVYPNEFGGFVVQCPQLSSGDSVKYYLVHTHYGESISANFEVVFSPQQKKT